MTDTKALCYNLRGVYALMGSVADMLRDYGRPDKADELAGAALMIDQWIAEIKAEQQSKENG